MISQIDLLDVDAPEITPSKPAPNARTKCRRVGCSHTVKHHGGACDEVGCDCVGFISPDDVAKPKRKAASDSDRSYREAYERGIRRAAPDQPFCVAGQKIGSLLGPVIKVHMTGDNIHTWIEQAAFDFRTATATAPQFWGGWQPFSFVKWLNMRAAKTTTVDRGPRLQPLAPRRF